SILGLPAAGWVVHRFGAARTVLAGVIASVLALATVGATTEILHSRPLTMAALFFAGLGIGIWDMSMNLEGATVERAAGRAIMPRFHAAFSAGTVFSALVGSGLTALGVGVLPHLAGTSLVVLLAALWATPRFLTTGAGAHGIPDAADSTGTEPSTSGLGMRAAWTERRTLLIGLVVLVAAFTEGSANDWLAIAFVDGHHLPAWAGVLAFATFLASMTVGRIAGTKLLDRYGRVRVLRATFLTAVLGSVLVVFGGPWLAFLGAALWGVGASLGFPVGMSAGADDPARAAARVSVISTIGYGAFLGGPPLLGFLGDHIGVLRAMLVVGLAVLLAFAALPAVREPAPEEDFPQISPQVGFPDGS
ncbi:MAG TPA: MFS transporter, partial [Dermatophilaceae bacterium]|nr:MFS transporter [Dermatophilaceae bacterium]